MAIVESRFNTWRQYAMWLSSRPSRYCTLLLTGTIIVGAVYQWQLSRQVAPVARVLNVEPDHPVARSAASGVDEFHAGISRGQYAEVCKTADLQAFRGQTALRCPEFLAYVHENLGDLLETKRSQLPSLENRPAGEPVRIGLQYTTRYQKGEAREEFEFRVDGPRATLIGYNIASDLLGR